MKSLQARLRRLERHAQVQVDSILHIWRLPNESAAEACARCAVDPTDFPQVQVHLWIGGQAESRLARPPTPLRVSQMYPALADLEHRLQEGLKQRMLSR